LPAITRPTCAPPGSTRISPALTPTPASSRNLSAAAGAIAGQLFTHKRAPGGGGGLRKRSAKHDLRERPKAKRSHKKEVPRAAAPHGCGWKAVWTEQSARLVAMQQQQNKWSMQEKKEGRKTTPLTWTRTAVALLWHKWERPPTDYWGGADGFVAFITTVLNLVPGSRKMVKKVLKAAKKAHAAGSLFEAGRRSTSGISCATPRASSSRRRTLRWAAARARARASRRR